LGEKRTSKIRCEGRLLTLYVQFRGAFTRRANHF
jgi:hypothetical protein